MASFIRVGTNHIERDSDCDSIGTTDFYWVTLSGGNHQRKPLVDLGGMPSACPPKGLDFFILTHKIFEK